MRCDQYWQIWCNWITSGPIPESKGRGAFFQQKGKEMFKKGKIFENLDKNVQNLKIFWEKARDCMR